jgi:helicase
MQKSVDAALKFLIASDMILEIGEHIGSTEFGTLVSRLYIDPRSAALIVSNLRKRTDYTDIGLLHLICSTPDMPKLYVRNTDRPALDRMLETNEPDLWLAMPDDDEDMEGYYRALKTAMLLGDWTDEMPDAKICERYSVGPGDIYGMVESINWLLHATRELSRMFAPGFNQAIREFEICMKNGIRRELLPLVKLRGIGRVRARRLFNNSITSPEAVLSAGIDTVTRIIGKGIAEQIFTQLERSGKSSTTQSGEETIKGQSTLFRFG